MDARTRERLRILPTLARTVADYMKGVRTGPKALTCAFMMAPRWSAGSLVLVDQPAEDLTVLDPAGRQRDHVGVVGGSSEVEGAVRPVEL
jgi:hypothetical protein